MTDRLDVAIVGAGIGAQHLEGYLAHPALFRVTCICDLDESRAAALAERTPGARVSTSYDALLGEPGMDVIDVCLPPHLHEEAARRALKSGRHVICEKPLAGSIDAVDALARIADVAGRMLIPVFQARAGNGFRRLVHLVRAGVAGRGYVTAIETHWSRHADYYAVPWRGKPASELGGAVVSHATHALDLACCVLGPARRVFARTATRVNPIETEDCAALCLEMTDGTLLSHSITLGSADEVTRLRFCFEHVTVVAHGHPYRPGHEPWRFLPRSDAASARIAAALEKFEPGEEGFEGFLAQSHAALTGKSPPPVTIAEARHAIELATAAYVSAATESAVELPLAADHPAYAGWMPWLARERPA